MRYDFLPFGIGGIDFSREYYMIDEDVGKIGPAVLNAAKVLYENQGDIVSHETIFDKIYGLEDIIHEGIPKPKDHVWVYVSRLKKIFDPYDEHIINASPEGYIYGQIKDPDAILCGDRKIELNTWFIFDKEDDDYHPSGAVGRITYKDREFLKHVLMLPDNTINIDDDLKYNKSHIRVNVWRLRKKLGHDSFERTNGSYRLNI